MLRFQKSAVVLSLVVLLVVGCGGPQSVKVTPKNTPAVDAVKGALDEVAKSGQLGSGGLTIQENLEKLKATDAAKADALLKDYGELAKAKDPQAVKAKANAMLGKL